MPAADFPFDGQFFPAKERKFGGVVFFNHFYEGDKGKLRRHIDFVNRIGCDAFAFNLKQPRWTKLPFAKEGRFGLKHIYADQIELLLNRLPGPKLIYSFSNPTAAAIEAIARRKATDVVGLICDSGPSARFVTSVYNLYEREKHFAWPLRLPVVPFFSFMWSPLFHRDLRAQLDTFPAGFPVLTIEGGRDPLISPEDMEAVFSPHAQLAWTKLLLPEAGHLTGLRDFTADYEPVAAAFIARTLPPS